MSAAVAQRAPVVEFSRIRLAITGAPTSGKTDLAYKLAGQLADHPTVLSTDKYKHLGYEPAGYAVADAIGEPEWHGIVEGVMVPRALRILLRRAPAVRPVDKLVILIGIYRADGTRGIEDELPKGQKGMAKGIHTILNGPVDEKVPGSPRVIDALEALGVEIEFRSGTDDDGAAPAPAPPAATMDEVAASLGVTGYTDEDGRWHPPTGGEG